MRRPPRASALAIVLALQLSCTQGAAPEPVPSQPGPVRLEWTLFRGDLARDGHPPAAQLTVASARRLQPAWQVDLGGEIVGSPVVKGGLVVVGTLGGVLAAYSTQQGSEVWKVKGLGPLAGSPAIIGGKVIVGSTESHLYAFDIENGNLIWDWRAPGFRPTLWSAPAMFKGLMVIGVGSQFGDVPLEAGRVVALDPASGDQIWSTCTQAACGPGGGVSSSPAIDASGHLFIGIGNPDDALWSLDVGIGKPTWKAALYLDAGRGLDVASTPVVLQSAAAESVAIGGAAGTFALFEARTGRLVWSRQLVSGSTGHGIAGSAAWDGSALYVPAASAPAGLFALSAVDGHTLWAHPTPNLVYSSPAVGRGVVVTGTGSRFGTEAAGSLLALATLDGHLVWSHDDHAAIVGSPVIVGDSVYAGDRAGRLLAFRPGP